MADQTPDTPTVPKEFTQNQGDDYQKLKRKNDELATSNAGFYNDLAQKDKDIEALNDQLDKQRARVRDLEAEEKRLKYETAVLDKLQKEHEETTQRLEQVKKEKGTLNSTHDHLLDEFKKLELELRRARSERDTARKQARDETYKVEQQASALTMEKEINAAYEQEIESLGQSKRRLDEIEGFLKENTILGRKLSKDISDCETSEIYTLLHEVIRLTENGRANTDAFLSDLIVPRQRPMRQPSMQDELADIGEDLDSNYAGSPATALFPSPKYTKRPGARSPLSDEQPERNGADEEKGRPELNLEIFTPTTIASLPPSGRPELGLSPLRSTAISPTTVEPPITSAAGAQPNAIYTEREATTWDIIELLPLHTKVILMIIGGLIYELLYLREQKIWLAANEVTRLAVIHLRDNSKSWLHVPAHIIYNAEMLLGVQKGLMG
ncbi:hypothetical protein BDZ85DRAFT_135540 [Elsinoe ampelina]|uniref:Uncharacterized protein n=1 Tax=Elsinoe ampelina TaxID=302913 RepID=A0A6A6G881_9PEZI|nr:hypothetical protein BDZ85DRAFT_135540 [Elsinoe ampelina]